jgi:hypothetical protein
MTSVARRQHRGSRLLAVVVDDFDVVAVGVEDER